MLNVFFFVFFVLFWCSIDNQIFQIDISIGIKISAWCQDKDKDKEFLFPMQRVGVCPHYYKDRTEDNEEQKSSTQFCKNCEEGLLLFRDLS